MITDQTQLGRLQGTIRRESWESTRKCQTDIGFDCRTQGEGTTLSTLYCLTARWIYADCDSEVIFRLDVVIKLGWIGWGWESKVLCAVQKERKKKKIWENQIVRIMEARRKEPLFWDSREKVNDVQVENGWSKDGNLRQIQSEK